ncbi:histone acetyltransferase [Saccharibacillus sp. O16]|nr:histone acetyltransferase [Saccharibacillus sp. O16]
MNEGTLRIEYDIRPVEPRDLPFLWEMLYESMYVAEGEAPFERTLLEEPAVRKYLEDWGRSGDVGLVAEKQDGTLLGSITARYFTADSPGYGFVSSDVPELGMALTADSRGKGIGQSLLTALLRSLHDHGVKRVSLSVDPRNEPAMKLYRRCGFEVVGREGTSVTMLASTQMEG